MFEVRTEWLPLLFLAAWTQPALAADIRDFTLHNSLGFPLAEVRISSATDPTWGSNILTSWLTSGTSRGFTFSGYGPGECKFDVRVANSSGNSWDIRGVDFCVTSDIELFMQNGVVTYRRSSPASDRRNFTLKNRLGFTIGSVFISETTNASWEDDVLGRDVLNTGENCPITFSGYASSVCRFDIRVKNLDGHAWDINNVNLCSITGIELFMDEGVLSYRAISAQ